MATTGYPLVISQYELRNHRTRTEHWSLVVAEQEDAIHLFELLGDYSNFAFSYRLVCRMKESRTLLGGCKIGVVPTTDYQVALQSLENTLDDVPIIRNDPNFDCQVWILQAVEQLKQKGGPILIDTGVTEAMIRAELASEKERSEVGKANLFERLFP